MSDSPELETVRKCTSHLETALKVLDRDLVHFLRDEGFVSSDVHDGILYPRSILTEVERAGELVKWIGNRVKQDPKSFHILLHHFKQRGVLYEPILEKLKAQYRAIVTSSYPVDSRLLPRSSSSSPSHFAPSSPTHLAPEPRPQNHTIINPASDLDGSQPPPPSQTSYCHPKPDALGGEPTQQTRSPLSPPLVYQFAHPPRSDRQLDYAGKSGLHTQAPWDLLLPAKVSPPQNLHFRHTIDMGRG